MANVSINGGVKNRRYGFGETDRNGAFVLSGVPQEIELENFEIWTRDEHLKGVIESRQPLVIRASK